MSKSYGKYKTCGICYGNNTPYYKDRRRKVRMKNKQRLENMIAHHNPEDYDDVFEPYIIPKKDTWMEPTDGSEKYDYKRIKKMMKKYNGWSGGMYITKNNKVKK